MIRASKGRVETVLYKNRQIDWKLNSLKMWRIMTYDSADSAYNNYVVNFFFYNYYYYIKQCTL